jgi:protein TonB
MFTTLVLRGDRIGAPRPRPGGMGPALLLAMAALHVCVIAAIALVARHAALSPPPPEPGIAIIFAQPILPPPAADTTQLATAALRPPVQPVIASLAPVPPMAIVQNTPIPRTRPASSHPAKPPPSIALIAPAHPATMTALPPAPPRPATPASLAGWEARIRQAVQDAAIYPAAARLRRREGRAEVQFDYIRGAVADVSVVRTSNVTALDTAALAAVTRARMPAPPPDIGKQPRIMLVWVQFKLTAED